jgi:hypothetical protein
LACLVLVSAYRLLISRLSAGGAAGISVSLTSRAFAFGCLGSAFTALPCPQAIKQKRKKQMDCL